MVRIELMTWERARAEASRIRFAVFVEEQGVPRDIELDERDAQCIHALAYEDEKVVGTGRLVPPDRGTRGMAAASQVGRMAVLPEFRGRGIGSRILDELMGRARQHGEKELTLSAQIHALEFYKSHGFQPMGEIYEEAGIPHRKMRRGL
jgi:predicted GNAT family N-acyltransferase